MANKQINAGEMAKKKFERRDDIAFVMWLLAFQLDFTLDCLRVNQGPILHTAQTMANFLLDLHLHSQLLCDSDPSTFYCQVSSHHTQQRFLLQITVLK